MSTKEKPLLVQLTVRAEAGWGDVPVIQRLKRAYKQLLRGYGIRIVDHRILAEEPPQIAQDGAGGVDTGK